MHSDEILRAQTCDETGDHQGALNWLVAAAHKQTPGAYTLLGKRYLLGDRATFSPPHGVQLLQRGAKQREAEAAHLLSILHALGVHVAQDWQQALSYLVLAADAGWDAAQQQLLLLSGDRKLADQHNGGTAYWRALARGIDLQYWHTPAQPQLLSQDPRIARVPDLLSQELCQWLVQTSTGRLSRALVYDAVQQQTLPHYSRTNRSAIFGLAETNIVFTLLQIRIAATVQAPLRHLEPVNVLHYKGGEEIQNHYDFIDPQVPNYSEQIQRNGDRAITFLVYLNDGYGAGETAFPKVDITHKGARGEGLFFVNVTAAGAPNLATLHAGLPPTQGEKWVLTQFIRNRPFF